MDVMIFHIQWIYHIFLTAQRAAMELVHRGHSRTKIKRMTQTEPDLPEPQQKQKQGFGGEYLEGTQKLRDVAQKRGGHVVAAS